MIIIAAAMSAVGIVGDYFLKRASGEASPLATPPFLVGLVLYSSTVFWLTGNCLTPTKQVRQSWVKLPICP